MAPLMTPSQVAALLSVSRRTVLRMLESGQLPGLRVGGLIRISQRAFTDWQAARETGSRTEATSAPAAPVVARLAALPVGYQPVFGPDGRLATPPASPAGARGRSTKGKKRPA